jgi:hypothetical protein
MVTLLVMVTLVKQFMYGHIVSQVWVHLSNYNNVVGYYGYHT